MYCIQEIVLQGEIEKIICRQRKWDFKGVNLNINLILVLCIITKSIKFVNLKKKQ